MKRLRLLLISLLTVLISSSSLSAKEDRSFVLTHTPAGWDNRSFAFCWYHEKDIMSLHNVPFCSPGIVRDLKMSPTARIFATLYQRGKRSEVAVYSFLDGHAIHQFRLHDEPTAIAFTANAKQFCVAAKDRYIYIYNTSDWKQLRTIPVAFVPTKMEISKNGYFIAISDENLLYVYNMETGRVRKILEMEDVVNHVTFSPDNNRMAVLTKKGELHMYDTKSFTVQDTYTDLGTASEAMFHPEGKYIAIITSPESIVVLNMKNPTEDRQGIGVTGRYLRHLGFARPVRKDYYLLYNSGNKLMFHELDDLVPDYQHLVSVEVEEKMDEWLKQMPGETLEDYHLRVNEETRALQYTKYENDAATELAGDVVGQAQVSFGNYDQEQNVLGISFDNMPDIYLDVPQEDVAEFSKPENLVFENTKYGVTEDDKFEMLYSEITNTETGKKYIYDNLDKQALDYMAMSDNFVPLDLIHQSSMEEVLLQEIREEVVSAAEEASLISEHTHIDVKTKVDASTNAEGEKIMNYAVAFNYDVEPEFSAAEDFGPGKYILSQSESAMAMLRIVENAFKNEFKQYLQPGKKVRIELTGSADAAPINSKIPYAEEYGSYTEALVYNKDELTTVTVTSATGITTNEQLAFLRAMSVKDYVEAHVEGLSTMQTDYDCYIRVSNERGAEFRRIGIKFIFIDAF